MLLTNYLVSRLLDLVLLVDKLVLKAQLQLQMANNLQLSEAKVHQLQLPIMVYQLSLLLVHS